MLSNAYFLAKFRFDTAENEPAKNLQNFRKMHFRKMHFRKIHFRKMHFLIAGRRGGPRRRSSAGRRPRSRPSCSTGSTSAGAVASIKLSVLTLLIEPKMLQNACLLANIGWNKAEYWFFSFFYEQRTTPRARPPSGRIE